MLCDVIHMTSQTQSSDGDSRWTARQMGFSDKPVSDKSGVIVQAVMYLQLITVTVMVGFKLCFCLMCFYINDPCNAISC